MGLEGMIADMLKKSDFIYGGEQTPDPNHFDPGKFSELADVTWVERMKMRIRFQLSLYGFQSHPQPGYWTDRNRRCGKNVSDR
ncbi:MAG: hypothetical protein Ct9H90mP9_3050 [Pseudomonadota bacterium]|nr:MAG: hypothetical protein Ct9H90mP9_3050 [Pseudomonadota bacterium]